MPQPTEPQSNAATATATPPGEHIDSAILWSPDASLSEARGPEKILLDQERITREQLERAVTTHASEPDHSGS